MNLKLLANKVFLRDRARDSSGTKPDSDCPTPWDTPIPPPFSVSAKNEAKKDEKRPAKTADLPTWNNRMERLTSWFLSHVHELPPAPFDLGRGIHIADPEQFYSMLNLDIETGPTGPRGRSGAAEDDLTALCERWAIQHEHEATAP